VRLPLVRIRGDGTPVVLLGGLRVLSREREIAEPPQQLRVRGVERQRALIRRVRFVELAAQRERRAFGRVRERKLWIAALCAKASACVCQCGSGLNEFLRTYARLRRASASGYGERRASAPSRS